ncbi:hypothetical protein B296_00028258, partial [Ensete ventricosum]
MVNRFVSGEFLRGRAAKWRKGSDASAPGINQLPLFSPLRRAYTRPSPLLQLAAVNRRRRENGKKIKGSLQLGSLDHSWLQRVMTNPTPWRERKRTEASRNGQQIEGSRAMN